MKTMRKLKQKLSAFGRSLVPKDEHPAELLVGNIPSAAPRLALGNSEHLKKISGKRRPSKIMENIGMSKSDPKIRKCSVCGPGGFLGTGELM